MSYKRELILVTTAGAEYIEFIFQLHSQFKRLGIAHFLALSMAVCSASHASNGAPMSCLLMRSYASVEIPVRTPLPHLGNVFVKAMQWTQSLSCTCMPPAMLHADFPNKRLPLLTLPSCSSMQRRLAARTSQV